MKPRGALFLALFAGLSVHGQERTQTVVAGAQFKAGGLHRMLFGGNYRDLWTTPVELPVLDLATFAGGLTPERNLGHGQTKALALRGRDSHDYTFRSVLKDPVGLLPPELRETLASRFVRDQMSSQHPAGHVVVPVLMDALGLLHNTPRLYVLPDDPALGEFRAEFAGQVGDLEEYAGEPGFGGSEELLDGAELWKRLDLGPDTRIDERAFLVARLLDHLIGDWDRHREQWRWARLPGQALLQPIAEDRDQAFVRFQGFVLTFARPGLPLLMNYGTKYPSLEGLLFDSSDVDRKLLAGLEWPAWEEAAAFVRTRLTDEVLERALRQMPRAYYDKVGPGLLAGLKARRDTLPEHARRYYRFLAREPDVHATSQAERAELERFPDGDVELRLSLKQPDGSVAPPYYRRRFRHGDTEELRLYLSGGDDEVVTSGPKGGILVRMVGGTGNDKVDDSHVGGLRFSDDQGRNSVAKGPGTHVDERDYEEPPPNPRGAWIPARDWGHRTFGPFLRFNGNPDLGLVANLSLKRTDWGFRQYPWATQQVLRASYSTSAQAFAGAYEGRFRMENSDHWLQLDARGSGYDIVRYYGLGNETSSDLPDRLYKVEQDLFTLQPAIGFTLGKRAELLVGPALKYAVTEPLPLSLLSLQRPYGIENFGQLGARADLRYDSSDRPGLPTRGAIVNLGGSVYAPVWSVKTTFGDVRGDAAVYFTKWATLMLKGGGQRVFGDYPFQSAAYLGGGQTVRGLRSQRYGGDGMLFGQAELHVPLAKVFLFAPGELGLAGLADVGRVFLDGEDSKTWHRGFGGGLYYVSPKRNNLVGVAVARSEKHTGFYFRLGTVF